MYVHIGGEVCFPVQEIIGIFDFDALTAANTVSRAFLARMDQEGRVEAVLPEIPRSVVLTQSKVFLTPLSVRVLKRRIRTGNEDDEDRRIHL